MIRPVLAAAALTVAAPAVAQPAAPAQPAQTGQRAAPAGIARMDHISVEAVGRGPALVLIPGLGTPREVYRPFVADLARRHRVLLVQVNGFGAGEAPGGNAGENILPGVVADISGYLERERLGAADVVGHSMGGLLGMMIARDHPGQVRRLMVVDALPFYGTLFAPDATVEAVRPQMVRMRDMLASGVAQQGAPSADDPMLATMSTTAEGRLQVSRWSKQVNPHVFAQALYEDATTDLRPDVARIGRVPVTVLYAARADVAGRARTLYTGAYAAAPSIRLVPVPDSLHFIMLDQPDRFRAALSAFLDGR